VFDMEIYHLKDSIFGLINAWEFGEGEYGGV
jgi:hypothetical protein